MMTFREKLESECPEAVNENYVGGARGCPRAWGYEKELPCARWISPAGSAGIAR